VLDQAPEIADPKEVYSGPQKLKGEITFEDVFFSYLKDWPVLKGVTLHIPAGRKFALVGYSGSGKTTLAKLIPRFYDIDRGSIQIDGVDIRKYPLHILRQNISMVLQDSILFEGTVRENIEIGRLGAPLEDVMDAAKKANIHDLIVSLPDGYETPVQEQGNNFSAGQRQRLAIARAFLRNAPILLLDEPTASLDVEAEAEVMHALNTLMTGRTVLTISHRLSTLGQVDEILVMTHGCIAERGSFHQLKQQHGLFAHLLDEQNRYNLDHEEGAEGKLSSVLASTSPHLPALQAESGSPTRSSARQLPRTGAVSVPLQTDAPREQSNGNGLVTKAGLAQEDIATLARVLVEIDGESIGEYQLGKHFITIGRSPASDIPIPNSRVSRLHAIIRWTNGAWVIEDAASMNGLSCQGQRIEQLALVNGDCILIDPNIVLRYEELSYNRPHRAA
jgi:ABC-type multidrug transport system ATPase subunit